MRRGRIDRQAAKGSEKIPRCAAGGIDRGFTTAFTAKAFPFFLLRWVAERVRYIVCLPEGDSLRLVYRKLRRIHHGRLGKSSDRHKVHGLSNMGLIGGFLREF